MRKRSIAALVWLLIVAIPVQGIAAAAMTHCGGHHHSAAQTTQSGHSLHDHAVAPHDAAGYGSHQYQSVSGGDADATDFKHDGYVKCSACAACCLGLALPSGFFSSLPSVPSVTASCGIFSSALDVVITGPERPPRPLLV